MTPNAGLEAIGTLIVLFSVIFLSLLASAVLHSHSATSKLEEALKPDEKWRDK